MKILVVAPRLPFPLDKGDRLTVYHLVKYLSERHHQVALACFCEPEQDPTWVEKVTPFCERVEMVPLRRLRAFASCVGGLLGNTPLQLLYYSDPRMHRAVRRLVEEFQPEALYGQLIRTGPYIEPYGSIPRVLALNLSMTLNYRRLVEHASNPARKLFYTIEHRRLARFENAFARRFDRVLYISRHDLEAVASEEALTNVFILPHGVDFQYFCPDPEVQKEPDSLVLTGNMAYAPNVDAALYLARDILPRVREQAPEAKLWIVGADPKPDVQSLARLPGVEVTGRVPDLRSYMRRALVAVAPLRIAAGLQNKVLEGMALGLPMVITPEANEAIEAVHGEHALVARDPSDFADAIVRLLKDPDTRARIGAKARELIVRAWSWEAHFSRLEQLLEHLILERREGGASIANEPSSS